MHRVVTGCIERSSRSALQEHLAVDVLRPRLKIADSVEPFIRRPIYYIRKV
jgi:hypothetical protein